MKMKIKQCCEEIVNKYNNIFVSNSYSEIPKGTPCYWTGEDDMAHDVEIKYCPFCGKKIELIEE